GVEGKIYRGRHIELIERKFNRRLQVGIYYSFIVKLHLLLSRMHVYIYTCGVYFQKEYINRISFFCNQSFECGADSMIEVGALDKSVIDKEELITSGARSSLRLTYVAFYLKHLRILIYRNKVLIHIATEQCQNTLFKVTGRQ